MFRIRSSSDMSRMVSRFSTVCCNPNVLILQGEIWKLFKQHTYFLSADNDWESSAGLSHEHTWPNVSWKAHAKGYNWA